MYHITFESYIKFEKESLKYFESPEGIIEGLHINKYYEDFIRDYTYSTGPKPEFNPWQYSTFKVGKKPKDVYSNWGKIGKGFFISQRFKEFLANFDLSEHVIFNNIKYFNGQEYKNDMCWIAFYKDYSEYYDITKSSYYKVKKDDWYYQNDEFLPNYIEKNIKFNTISEMSYQRDILEQQGIELREERIDINLSNRIDFFPLFKLWNGDFFCSEEFIDLYKKYKFSGLSFTKSSVSYVETSIFKE